MIKPARSTDNRRQDKNVIIPRRAQLVRTYCIKFVTMSKLTASSPHCAHYQLPFDPGFKNCTTMSQAHSRERLCKKTPFLSIAHRVFEQILLLLNQCLPCPHQRGLDRTSIHCPPFYYSFPIGPHDDLNGNHSDKPMVMLTSCAKLSLQTQIITELLSYKPPC